MSARTDVVVVGAGIVGAACAYALAQAGAKVQVVERDYPAAGTSRACDGLILFSDKLSPAELALGRASASLWSHFADISLIDFEYARHGCIVLAETEADLPGGAKRAAELRSAGLIVESLDRHELHKLEPYLAPDLAGGFYYTEEAQLDPRRATVALLTAAQQLGAELLAPETVTGLRRDVSGRVTGVLTAGREIGAGAVVCAAGVWSGDLLRSSGVTLPVRPRKGHVLVTGRLPRFVMHPLLEGSYASSVHTGAEGVQVALVAEPTAGNTLLLGSSREFAGFDRSVSPEVMAAISARAVRFLPALATVGGLRCYTGLRPWSPDHLPLVGPAESLPGLWLATGHEGAGIGLAPLTGQLIAEMIVRGVTPELARPVLPSRFDSTVRAAIDATGSSDPVNMSSR